jgi:hypothetical protein
VLRGYGPLAVLAVLLLVMALLVPSKTPPSANVGASGPLPADQGTGDTIPGTEGQAATAGQAGTAGGTTGGTAAKGALPAKSVACAGDQVPGDPYSPPCIQFSGANGGVTSKGVTPTEIHVAYRVLNEKGF